jgi:bla regulator protein blaR1
MKYLAAIATLIFTTYAAAFADKFEVAAIHPSDPGSRGAIMQFLPGGGFSMSGMTIRNLIWLAWQLPSERVTGGPKWIDSGLYDIQAKAPAGSTSAPDMERLRIQALLADRFQLKVHSETKTSLVYLLTIAKNGLKMEEAKGSDSRYNNDKGSLLPWGAFVADLSRRLGRPVVDKTGLKGVWYIKLRYSDDDGPSIFTAVQEQLGLKLDSSQGPVDTLVIDSIARPSLN